MSKREQYISECEKKFTELKDKYAQEYERTNGKKVPELFYYKGYVNIGDMKVRITEFEEMTKTLSGRPDFVLN